MLASISGAAEYPELAAEFKRRMSNELPANWKQATDAIIADTNEKAESLASRQASQKTIAALAPVLPEFLGGSNRKTLSATARAICVGVDERKSFAIESSSKV